MNDPLGFTEYRKSQIRLKAGTEIPVSKVIQLHGSPKMINFNYFIHAFSESWSRHQNRTLFHAQKQQKKYISQ